MSNQQFPNMGDSLNHAHPDAQSRASLSQPLRAQPFCQALEPTLALLALGVVDTNDPEGLAARAHMNGCTWCQRRLREYTATREALAQVGDAEIAQASHQPQAMPSGASWTNASAQSASMANTPSSVASSLATLDLERIMRVSNQREQAEGDGAHGAHAATAGDADKAPTAPLWTQQTRRRLPFRRVRIAWAAVAAALVVAVLVGLLIAVRGGQAQNNGVVVVNGCRTGTQRVTEFQSIGEFAGAPEIVPGPGCSLYVSGLHVWRITTDGKFTPYPHLTSSLIASAPDGSLWTVTPQMVIHFDPRTNTTRQYPLPSNMFVGYELRVATDGSVWFPAAIQSHAGDDANVIARLDPQTGAIRQFTDPEQSSAQSFFITDMILGPDGSVWWATYRANSPLAATTSGWIQRLNPATGAIARYHLPRLLDMASAPSNTAVESNASNLTFGPDGAVWFVVSTNDTQPIALGRLTPQGKVVAFPLPIHTSLSTSTTMTLGPDGDFWLTSGGNQMTATGFLVRVTPQGHITTYSWFPSLPAKNLKGYPLTILTGPDKRLWVIYAIYVLNQLHVGGAASGGPVEFRVMRITLPPGV